MRMFALTCVMLLSGCVVGDLGAPGESGDDQPGSGGSGNPGGGGGGGDEPEPEDGGGGGPTNPSAQGIVVAYPGGTSIAVRWSPLAGATSYEIARDGAKIGTQTPGFHPDFPEKDGNGWIDQNVSPGVAYKYTVTAVGGAGGLVGETTVTLSTKTTPKPALTIDTSRATDLAGWMNGTVKPFLEIWYPKVGDILAQPDYVPPHNLSLTIDPNYDGVAYCSGQSIVMSAAYARAHQQDLGAWIHEATHAMQSYQNIPGWITEGMADYTRDFIIHDRGLTAPGPGNTYKTGYSEGAYFLAFIRSKYDPTFVHTLNVAAHGNTYNDNLFVQRTGKSIDALWTELTGSPPPAPVKFVGLANRCLQAGTGSSNDAAIGACDGGLDQGFGVIRNSNSTISIANNHNCIDVAASSTENGARIWMYPCNGTGAQEWVQQADGTLKNPASGRCLDDPNGSTTEGTALRLWDCNGSTAQRFSTLP